MSKKPIVALFELLPKHLLRKAEESHKSTWLLYTVTGTRSDSNTSQIPSIIVNQPMTTVNVANYDAIVSVHGGGLTGQAGAIRHGISRALVKENPTMKPELKKAGFLKRDPRMKERKKYGLKKARRAPQFSKR